ncbi:MAG: hypothetical protein BGN88_00655 [Clostridiales bacterium 43-6]|nr:MAG: hypothetical protein BGN88_00655 [Clostridiales bacterium 43-6]
MIVLFENKEECTGCTACKHVCKKNAITMQTDEEGFQYPHVDEKLCVNCMMCVKVCPIKVDKQEDKLFQQQVYAAKNKNHDVLMSSTSGGMFTAISDSVLAHNGYIYGVKFDENLNVIHNRAETAQQRDEQKGSKYVQSDLSDTFIQVKNDLEKGKQVLFTGTPCQNAGLINFLQNQKTNCANLVQCDFVCHHTPSPLIWKDHIHLIESKTGRKVVKYECRSKVKGWHAHTERYYLDDGTDSYKTKLSQNFTDLFDSALVSRPACQICKFSGKARFSDITIADYWGIEKCNPEFDNNTGVSLLIINSERGMKLFEVIRHKIDCIESTFEDAFRVNHSKPSKAHPMRKEFWEDYKNKGYVFVLKKYVDYSIPGRIYWNFKKIVRPVLKFCGIRK